MRNDGDKMVHGIARCLLSLAAAVSLGALSNADELAPFEINQKGELFQVVYDAKTKNLTKASVYFITSNDNSTSATEVYVSGPAGIKFKGRSALLGTRSAVEFLKTSSGWNTLNFMSPSKPKGVLEVVLPAATGEEPSSANALFHLRRDTCSPKGTRYITQIAIDLTDVPSATFDTGFVMKVGALEYPYKEGRRASIKPSSDGKYKGEPIGLFETMSYGNEQINIVSWRGTSISRERSTKIVKYVSYKGLSLSLARLNGFLSGGGKATFELTNGSNVYSVCFALQRKRQSANGYPAP